MVPISSLQPGQSPSPATLGAPVCAAITTAFTTQAEEMVDEMRRPSHQQNGLPQEAEEAERE